jgi:hypothetical protein
MQSLSKKYRGLENKHKIIQVILFYHRQWAVKRFEYILPKRYTENRYGKSEHRNRYEVDRVWDEKLKLTIGYIDSVLHEFPFLKYLPGKMLADRYEGLKRFKKIESQMCDAFVKNHFYERKTKESLEDKAADNRLDREHQFLNLLFELIDDAENLDQRGG